MISNFIFTKLFRVVRNDDIGHIAYRPHIGIPKPKIDHEIWYTCIEKYSDKKEIINGFDCMRFDNYIDAEKQKINLCKDVEVGTRRCIISVCKWIPAFFHPFIINYKLKNEYWKNKIQIY